MSIGVWDTNSRKLGSIDGNSIYANGQKVGAVVNGNKIWDAHGHEVGAVPGLVIGAIIGSIVGTNKKREVVWYASPRSIK